MLLGLGLAAVVIVGAVGTYNAARESANRSAALTLLSQLRANIEAAYAGAPSYGNNADLVPAIDRRGGIPAAPASFPGKSRPSAIPSAAQSRSSAGRAASPTVSASPSRTSTTPSARRLATPRRAQPCPRRAGSMTFNGTTLASPVTNAQVTAGCNKGDAANDIGFTFG